MAHVIQHIPGSRFLTIVYDPTLPWDSRVLFPGGMDIVAIEMAPSAPNEAVVVRDGNNGPRIFSHISVADYDIAVRYYGRHTKYGTRGVHCSPYIAAAEALGNFTITFEFV